MAQLSGTDPNAPNSYRERSQYPETPFCNTLKEDQNVYLVNFLPLSQSVPSRPWDWSPGLGGRGKEGTRLLLGAETLCWTAPAMAGGETSDCRGSRGPGDGDDWRSGEGV